jgi:hypothetical protein
MEELTTDKANFTMAREFGMFFGILIVLVEFMHSFEGFFAILDVI